MAPPVAASRGGAGGRRATAARAQARAPPAAAASAPGATCSSRLRLRAPRRSIAHSTVSSFTVCRLVEGNLK